MSDPLENIKHGLTSLLGAQNQAKRTQVQNMVDLACNPQLFEPDLAMNLEICDFINQKQKSTPREAALAILEHVHSREMHESMLALDLLDNCVKNCGYPFHLQIASKEFLNEFVKKFPERPPAVKTPVQEKILELLQQWNFAVYETSKFRRDMIHINDMYRLLHSKGYSFPTLKAETANVMRVSESLKTRDELEQEDRIAQSAKLQELLRRGTPTDLQQANQLMKIMAGYPHENQIDYAKKETEELDRIEERTSKLKEMLVADQTTKVAENDRIQELLSAVKTAQPKITKWIEDNLGDEDEQSRMDRLLYLNDLMNEVVEMYETLKRGGKISQKTSQNPKSSPPKQSLIDADVSQVQGEKQQPQQNKQKNDLLGDLMGLSFDPYPSGFGQGGAIQLGITPTPPGKTVMTATPVASPPMTLNQPQFDLMTDLSSTFPTPPLQTTSPVDQQKIMFDKNGVKITCKSQTLNDKTSVTCYFSNATPFVLDQILFQVAVQTNMQLKMEMMVGNSMPPNSVNSVMQPFQISHGVGIKPKIRFRLTYVPSKGNPVTEEGEFQF